jgi:hypothetical protein
MISTTLFEAAGSYREATHTSATCSAPPPAAAQPPQLTEHAALGIRLLHSSFWDASASEAKQCKGAGRAVPNGAAAGHTARTHLAAQDAPCIASSEPPRSLGHHAACHLPCCQLIFQTPCSVAAQRRAPTQLECCWLTCHAWGINIRQHHCHGVMTHESSSPLSGRAGLIPAGSSLLLSTIHHHGITHSPGRTMV